MSDLLAGLTRRTSALAFDMDTKAELSFILEEVREHGGAAADALLELALGGVEDEDLELMDPDDDSVEPEVVQAFYVMDDEDDALPPDGEIDPNEEAALDAELAALEGDGDGDEDDSMLGETGALVLGSGEVLVL